MTAHIGAQSPNGLSVQHVTKVYRRGIVANDDICLAVERGEVFGLLGPNGAGKTTLVGQVIGLVRPTSGTIRIGAVDVSSDRAAARALCSFLPQDAVPIQSLKVSTAVQLIPRIRGADARRARERSDELLGALQLDAWRDTLGSSLSGGVLRLVGFIMAAVHPGHLVILDEPTNDVDPLRRRLLWREVRSLAEAGSAVILVTHNVLEAEHAVDRLAIIDGGRVVANGTPSALKQDVRDTLRLVVSLDPLASSSPPIPPFARDHSRVGRRLSLVLGETDAPVALAWARDQAQTGLVEEYQIGATTLEDTYARIVGRASDGAAEGEATG